MAEGGVQGSGSLGAVQSTDVARPQDLAEERAFKTKHWKPVGQSDIARVQHSDLQELLQQGDDLHQKLAEASAEQKALESKAGSGGRKLTGMLTGRKKMPAQTDEEAEHRSSQEQARHRKYHQGRDTRSVACDRIQIGKTSIELTDSVR